jgi:hypothetical protein
MNRVDLELEQFMKLAEADSHKYKRNNIKWSPYASVWIHQQWLLAWVQTFLLGKTMMAPGLGANVPLGKDKRPPQPILQLPAARRQGFPADYSQRTKG